MKSDGNGGIIINKGVMALITLIIILATTFASVVAFSAGVRSEVQHNTQRIDINIEGISDVEQEAEANKESMGKVETNINNMKEDISEIKADVKLLIKQNGG